MRLVRGLWVLCALGSAAIAAPPPPPIYPAEFPAELGGYSLPSIYQRYHFWVGRGREAALRKAISPEPMWRGMHLRDSVISSKIDHYDFATIRMDALDRYCAGDQFRGQAAGDCEYRYRYAFVPGSLYSDPKRERLIRESFRPAELTALLASQGWTHPGPDAIWTDQRLRQIFEQHTDLAALYGPSVEVHEVGETDCPALKQSLAGLTALTLTIDPDDLGNLQVPPPHGQQTRITMSAVTPDGGRVLIEGADPLYKYMQPIWDAVETCSPPSYASTR